MSETLTMELATPISYVIRITLGVQDILMSSNEMDPEKLPVLPVINRRMYIQMIVYRYLLWPCDSQLKRWDLRYRSSVLVPTSSILYRFASLVIRETLRFTTM